MAYLWETGGLSWKELSRRVWREARQDILFNRAAAMAFYFLFSVFPLLLFLTALLGLLSQGGTELRDDMLSYLSRVAPVSASALIYDTVDEIGKESGGGKLSFGFLLALWTASSGIVAIIEALNAAYDVKESRPWWKERLIAIELTLAIALLIVTALVLVLYGGDIAEGLAARLGSHRKLFAQIERDRLIWRIRLTAGNAMGDSILPEECRAVAVPVQIWLFWLSIHTASGLFDTPHHETSVHRSASRIYHSASQT